MFGIKTAAQAFDMLKDQKRKLIEFTTEGQDHRITEAANAVQFWTGVATALGDWEETLAKSSERAVEREWDATRLLVVRMQRLTDMALQASDDTWSGRGNDARRSFLDGRREALDQIHWDLKAQADAIFASKSK